MNEEQGFDVVDKRGAKEEAPAEQAETQPSEAPDAQAPSEQPETDAAEEHEHAGAADAYSIAAFTIEMLAAAAWRTMGMQIDPGTGKIEKDLEQARFAIDCISALYDKMHPKLDETARRDVRGMISNLQINFVNQSQ